MQFSNQIPGIRKRVESFSSSKKGRSLFKLLRWIFLAAILSWLGYNLYEIGGEAVWENLPAQPLFYFLFVLMFLSAPVAQLIIYRLTWQFDIWRHLGVFVKKRILNSEVIGYSGEVYLFSWARKHIDLPEIRIGETIRDYNILSALASTSLALLFLSIYLFIGKAQIRDLVGNTSPLYIGLAVIALLIVVPLVIRFRRYIFSTPLKLALTVFGIYFFRLFIGLVLQVGMWEVTIPEVPLATWITYTAVSILISRIPVSNKKLIFVGVGVELSASLGIPEAAMFGLLISIAALEKILYFGLYLFFSMVPGFGGKDLEAAVVSGTATSPSNAPVDSEPEWK